MDHPRILLLLRIAFSSVCAVVCLLLIGLWIRSSRTEDQFGWAVTSRDFLQLGSAIERVSFSWTTADDVPKFQKGFIIGHELPESFTDRVRQIRKDKIENPFGFSVIRGPRKTFWSIPHVWLVGMFAIFVAATWIRQFSLRTLLIVVVIISAILMLIVWGSPQRRPQPQPQPPVERGKIEDDLFGYNDVLPPVVYAVR